MLYYYYCCRYFFTVFTYIIYNFFDVTTKIYKLPLYVSNFSYHLLMLLCVFNTVEFGQIERSCNVGVN